MAQKKKRTPKVSKGIHGATKHPLTTVQRVLLGKGMYETFIPAGQGQRKNKKD